MKFRLFLFSILLITIIALSVCSYELNKDNNNDCFPFCESKETEQIETVSINGINKEIEISNDYPIEVNINGMGHIIVITENTDVREINVNGQDILIQIPEGLNPKIKDNGINVKIEYY